MGEAPHDLSGPAPFPSQTAWSTILAARDRDSPEWKARLDSLISKYWKPVASYLIRRWILTREDAVDLTQEFFLNLYEKDFLKDAAPERGRFRTFLKLKLHDLVIDDLRRKASQKRGGASRVVHWEAIEGGPEPPWAGLSPEEAFDRDWAACALREGVRELEATLKAQGKSQVFEAFRNCVLSQPPMPYAACARKLGIEESDVRNYVFRTRAQLRHVLRQHIRESVDTDAEVELELAYILKLFES